MNLGRKFNSNKTEISEFWFARNAYDVALKALDKLKSIMSSAAKLSKESESSSVRSRYVTIQLVIRDIHKPWILPDNWLWLSMRNRVYIKWAWHHYCEDNCGVNAFMTSATYVWLKTNSKWPRMQSQMNLGSMPPDPIAWAAFGSWVGNC